MAVHNAEHFVLDAVASILAQTHTDFEFLIIDDASSAKTRTLLETITDPRVRLVTNPTNLGQSRALNRGLELARGQYVARMDADDISHPCRLERQLAYLTSRPATILVGSNVQLINPAGDLIGLRTYPESHADIIDALRDYSPLCHPSVMFLKAPVLQVGGYREQYSPADDYDLWLRLQPMGTFANLDANLVKYRIHPGQLTLTQIRRQHRNHMLARRHALGLAGYSLRDTLTGKSGTLGSKYLYLADLQRQLAQPSQARQLALHALASSPLSLAVWTFLRDDVRRTRACNVAVWYLRKLLATLAR
jgi:glycosyltransferase involved in cell wall biosynthesis